MVREAIRYSPPEIEVPPEADWLLARALGPAERPWTGRLPAGTDWSTQLVGRSGLLGRVRARAPRDLLQAELSEELLVKIERSASQTLAVELLQEKVCAQLATLASQRGAPVIFLKGLALRFGHHAGPGTRYAGDIDVLMSRSDIDSLQQDLIGLGCEEVDLQTKEHHLPLLMHPLGVALEIHWLYFGVKLHGKSSSTAEETLSSGHCSALDGWPERIFVPDPMLLTAHFLVHGLAQHGFSPDSYPALQLLADLQDLDFSGDRGEEFLSEGYAWVENDVTREEITALRETLRRLEEGQPVSGIVEGTDSTACLARHLLAGSMDARYRQALKLDGLRRSVSEHRGLRGVVSRYGGAVFLTRGQIDRIYGTPKSELGYLARRVWRPFDLVGRTVKTLRAQRGLRIRE